MLALGKHFSNSTMAIVLIFCIKKMSTPVFYLNQ